MCAPIVPGNSNEVSSKKLSSKRTNARGSESEWEPVKRFKVENFVLRSYVILRRRFLMNDDEKLRLKLRLFLQECLLKRWLVQFDRKRANCVFRPARTAANHSIDDEAALNNRFRLSRKSPGLGEADQAIRLDYL